MKYTIQVRKDLDDHNSKVFIRRAVRFTANRQSVLYKGRRYELLGGIRCPFFINLDKP